MSKWTPAMKMKTTALWMMKTKMTTKMTTAVAPVPVTASVPLRTTRTATNPANDRLPNAPPRQTGQPASVTKQLIQE